MDSAGIRTPEPDDLDLEFKAIVDNIGILADSDSDVDQDTIPTDSASSEPATSCLDPVADGTEPDETPPQPAAPPAPVEQAPEWLAPPKPPALVVPARPDRPDTGVVNWWARAFPHIVWLSVFAGLTGQVFGFAEFFGGTRIAWAIAVVLGGTFEFMMVACSSRGLRAIGLGRHWREFAPFLALGTGAAGFAAYMNMNHFAGWLGLAAATVSMLGYSAHVLSHLYDELEHRRALGEWERERAEIEAEIKARAQAERAEYDDYRRQLSRQRTNSLTSSSPSELPGSHRASPPAPTKKSAEHKHAGRAGGKATRADAIRIGIEQNVATPAKLRDALKVAGYKLPASSSTIENWCKAIKDAQASASPSNRP